MVFLGCLFIFLFVLVGIAFFTLFERKILGFVQFRFSCCSVGLGGLFQPFSDGLKLFSSEFGFMFFGNFYIYIFIPLMSLLVSLVFWILYPLYYNFFSFDFGGLFFFCCSCFGVYFIIFSGWSSNSLYSVLGSMRCVSQSISYEVCFFMIFVFFFVVNGSLNLIKFYYFQFYSWFFFFFFPLFFMYFSCVLAETNRSPYDFSEGESELVSGFNLEYSAFNFSLFFLSEYGVMMFMSFLSCLVFFGSDVFSFFFFFSSFFFCFLFILVRGSLPRFRYDKLMYLSWSCYLPLILNLFVCEIVFKLLIYFISFCNCLKVVSLN